MKEPEWVEVWINWDLRYVLLLRFIDGRYEVIDPQADPRKLRSALPAVFDTYEEAGNWLCEDEFTKVKGRMNPALDVLD